MKHTSQVEHTEKQILEMLVSWNYGWKILEISCELVNCYFVPWFNVVPAPNKFVESLFLWFFVGNHFGVTSRIVNLSDLLQSNFGSNQFSNSIVRVLNRFESILVKFTSEVLHEHGIGDVVSIGLEVIAQVSHFLFS
jgi:hypothetical protein